MWAMGIDRGGGGTHPCGGADLDTVEGHFCTFNPRKLLYRHRRVRQIQILFWVRVLHVCGLDFELAASFKNDGAEEGTVEDAPHGLCGIQVLGFMVHYMALDRRLDWRRNIAKVLCV